MRMSIFARMYVCTLHACLELEEKSYQIEFAWNRVTGGYEAPYGCWKSSHSPPQEQQQVLITIEPLLLPQKTEHFKLHFPHFNLWHQQRIATD